MNKTSVQLDIAGKILTLETGQLAMQATIAMLARAGDTQILVTVVQGKERDDIDYFPLTVEYVERLYAGGRIKGSRWVKREGRPSDDSILSARLIDRSVRPFFPKEYKREVQIVVTVLSVDGENEPDVLAINAVSAALAVSPIPWNGPVAAVRMGYKKESENGSGQFLINPGGTELASSDLDLIITQTKEKTLMLEAGALQLPEAILVEAIEKAHVETKAIIKFIEDLVKKIGQKKQTISQDPVFAALVARIEKSFKDDIIALIPGRATKEATGSDSDTFIEKIFEEEKMANPEEPIDKKKVAKAVEYILFKGIREQVLSKQKRPDGRKIDEIREISGQVSLLTRTHGSAIFQRGTTQGLCVVTLGSPQLEQLIESAGGEEAKRYIHHYAMPPYSVGETGRMGVPSRREIGHGALAERAIMAVIPSKATFPYTIRVVSEILSSNGSTSMAATCGSALALMDAGVPITKPVAGIAMGLMSDTMNKFDGKYFILTDILGLEDFSGDMDFKVAGTEDGVTAIQLDVKISGITIDQIKETFERAKAARLFILGKMHAIIPAPRTEVSEYAPKIEQVKVPVEKIGEVIGPGGRMIRNIIAETGATVDVEDDGTVTISSISDESVEKAVNWIKGLTRELQAGEVFEEGIVKRILSFGAFVEVLPGKEGMVHVSQMSTEFVKNPTDVVQIGQKVKVRVMEIDDQGRTNLSMLFGEDAEKGGSRGGGERRSGGGGHDFRPEGRTFNRSGDRPPFRSSDRSEPERAAQPAPQPHPLSMQFRRERMQQQSNNRGGRGRPGGTSRFRRNP